MNTKRCLLLALVLGLVVGLPLLGHWARRGTAGRCVLDGVPIDPLYAARVVDEQGQSHSFCCINCARLWLSQHQAAPRAVFVTDEVTSEEIDAASAWMVRSQVVSVAATRNCLHAFRHRADAERHARSALGRLLSRDENPFLPARALPPAHAGRQSPPPGDAIR
jgi:hypothetical protein